MSVSFSAFPKDIVLDDNAFSTAANEFADLSSKLQALRNEVEEMINTLKVGFDTPAGRQFISSCEANLYEPLDAQKLVLDHISETLRNSMEAYESVFREYDSLQSYVQNLDI